MMTRIDAPYIKLPSGQEIQMYTPEYVGICLEQMGRTLYMMPDDSRVQGFKSFWPEVVHDAHEAYGWTEAQQRIPLPTASQISHYEYVIEWIKLIKSIQIRRIVLLRSLYHPLKERPVFSWRIIAEYLDVDRKTAKYRYDKGLEQICNELNKKI